jgi:hypothetical protein
MLSHKALKNFVALLGYSSIREFITYQKYQEFI